MGATDVEIRLFGTTEIISGTGAQRVSSPKLRTMLGLLLISPGSVSAVDALVAEVWRTPPKNALATVQTYLYQLRRHLDGVVPGGSRHLVTHPARYQAVFPAEAVDVLRFQSLAAAGLQALSADQPEEADELLSEALRLWRGEPFADIPLGPGLTAAAIRLRELRDLVEISRIDAAVLSGRHAEMVPVLERLLVSQPLHEGFAARLMVAYAKSGRADRAARLYERLGARLDEELGLPPMPRLQRLRDMLAAPQLLPDWELLRIDERPGQTGVIMTDHLYTQPISLSGRAGEITMLSEWLVPGGKCAPGPRIAAVHGPTGAGKTAVCLSVARGIQHHFPDGLLVLDLGGCRSAPELIREILGRAGVRTDDLAGDELVACYRSWAATQRFLLVLDNARSLDQVLPLVPTCEEAGLLVNGPIRLGGLLGTRSVTLDALGEADTIVALRRCLGERWTAESPDAARAVARSCHGLPLTVQAAAQIARSRGLGARELAALLADEKTRWRELDAAVPRIADQFARCWAQLDDDARRAWSVLAALPDRFGVADAARVLDVPPAEAAALLGRLREVSVLRDYPDSRYSLYDLARGRVACASFS